MIGNCCAVRDRAFSRRFRNRSSRPEMSPPHTECFDIFSPPPGESDVINQVDRLSSKETKIAPRSVWIVAGDWAWFATIGMGASIGGA
jgi:hypothetical protein